MTLLVDHSYQLGFFRDNEDSLRRLKKQASIALDLEFEHLHAAGLKKHSRIMDLGCGPGILSAALMERAAPAALLSVDCNEVSVSETLVQLAGFDCRSVTIKKLNIYDAALAEQGRFDFIYSRLVFQHLSDPVRALSNVRNCLAPQGRFCICDIDDHWLGMAPASDAFGSFIARVGKAQSERGGDRYVGTKLAHYLQLAGYTDVKSTMLLLSTDLIGKEAFCDLIFGYKLEVVPDAEIEIARQEVDSIRKGIKAQNGWAGVGVFFVSGKNGEGEV